MGLLYISHILYLPSVSEKAVGELCSVCDETTMKSALV